MKTIAPAPLVTLSVLASALALPAPAQESRAILDAPLVVADGRSRFVTLLDVNGDGYQDALSAWWTNTAVDEARLAIWTNDGAGKLVEGTPWTLAMSDTTIPLDAHVEAGRIDVDHDGRDDFWVSFHGANSSQVAVYTSPGNDQYLQHPLLSWTGGAGAPPAFADFDQNGTLDRAVVEGGVLRITAIELVGSSFVPVERTTLTLGSPADHVQVIDANGDATPDLAVNAGGTLYVVPVVGAVAGTPLALAHGVTAMPMPMAGDVDGDGDQDLVVFDMTSYVVVRRTGALAYTIEPQVTGGPAAKLADVDGDGDLDGICCGGGGPTVVYNTRPSTFRVSLNDGTGVFAPAFTMAGLGSFEIAGAADLDHDGDTDLVAGRCVYYARGPLVGTNTRAFPHPHATPRASFDVDRDGDEDFDAGLGVVGVNRGDGSMESQAVWCTPAPAGMTFQGPGYPGDFDGDGDVDLVVGMFSGPTFVSMRLLLGNGGGGYVDGGDAGAPGVDFRPLISEFSPEASVVGDADGDGDVDLFTRTTSGSMRSTLWLNDGSGHFTFSQEILNELVQAVGEFGPGAGDGWPDLVSKGFYTFIHFGTGPTAWNLGGGVALSNMAEAYTTRTDVADVDGDGRQDVAVVGATTGAWIELRDGTPSGWNTTVAFTTLSANPAGGRSAQFGDVDGDGDLDLIVKSPARAEGAVAMVLQDSTNHSWTSTVTQVVFRESNGVVQGHPVLVRDVDGDGDADVLTDEWIVNRTLDGAAAGARVQSGASTGDAFGMKPTLGARGPFRVGELAELRVRGASPRCAGFLFVSWVGGDPAATILPSVSPTRLPLLQTIHFATGGDPLIAGSGAFTKPFTIASYLAGRTVRYRGLILDPLAPGGSVSTNTLEITYGP